MMARFVGLVLPAAALLTAMSGQAKAAVVCQGQVAVVRMINQRVAADWGFGLSQICNISVSEAAPTTTLSVQQCQAIFSQLLTAQVAGKDFATVYSTSTTCAAAIGTGGGYPVEQPYSFLIYQ